MPGIRCSSLAAPDVVPPVGQRRVHRPERDEQPVAMRAAVGGESQVHAGDVAVQEPVETAGPGLGDSQPSQRARPAPPARRAAGGGTASATARHSRRSWFERDPLGAEDRCQHRPQVPAEDRPPDRRGDRRPNGPWPVARQSCGLPHRCRRSCRRGPSSRTAISTKPAVGSEPARSIEICGEIVGPCGCPAPSCRPCGRRSAAWPGGGPPARRGLPAGIRRASVPPALIQVCW